MLLPVEGARERGEAEKAMWCLTYEDLAPGLPAQERGEKGKKGEREINERGREGVRRSMGLSSILCSIVQTSPNIYIDEANV